MSWLKTAQQCELVLFLSDTVMPGRKDVRGDAPSRLPLPPAPLRPRGLCQGSPGAGAARRVVGSPWEKHQVQRWMKGAARACGMQDPAQRSRCPR